MSRTPRPPPSPCSGSEAAKIAFENGPPIVIVGLDATNRAPPTQGDMAHIESYGGGVYKTLPRTHRHNVKAEGGVRDPTEPNHDPPATP